VRGLLALSDVLDRIGSFFGRYGSWAIVPMVLITVFDVVTRKYPTVNTFIIEASNHIITSTNLQEMEWHLHTLLFSMCLGWGYLRDSHVRVDLVREKLPQKTQQWIEFLGCSLFLTPYLLVITYFGFDFVASSYATGEGSAAMTGLPHRFIIKGILVLGLILGISAGVAVWLRKFVYLFGGEETRQDALTFASERQEA